jgi:hypothetical protein
MRRETLIAAIAVAALVAALGVLILALTRPSSEEPDPPPATASASAPARPKPEPMAFSRDGLAAEIVQAVERPARKGRVRVAVRETGGARWVCVLVVESWRYYELDRGFDIGDFPALEAAGFQPAPPQASRATLSVYRSVAKRAMSYDAARGDRVIILLCPQAEWDALELSWPPTPPDQP